MKAPCASVPNDPQAEERLEMIRRIQRDYDQIAVQMNTIGGTLEEQVAQVAGVRSMLSHNRQLLPNSQRLAQMQQEVDNKLASIRSQVNDQAQMSLNHANNSTTLDERILLMNASIKLMELGLELDPTDGNFAEMLMRSRNLQADITRAQQSIRRAQALISQNFDAELAQARQMLAEMVGDYAQDERFRSTVNDLFSRYLERAEESLQEGNIREAQTWLDTMREDPLPHTGSARRYHPHRQRHPRAPQPWPNPHAHHSDYFGHRGWFSRRHDARSVGGDTIPNGDIYTDLDPNAHDHADADDNLHAIQYTDCDRYADQHANRYRYLYTNRHFYADVYTDIHEHADKYVNAHRYNPPPPIRQPSRRRRSSFAA